MYRGGPAKNSARVAKHASAATEFSMASQVLTLAFYMAGLQRKIMQGPSSLVFGEPGDGGRVGIYICIYIYIYAYTQSKHMYIYIYIDLASI